VPSTGPDEAPVMLGGRWPVAPGTRVSVHHYATYRNPANFANPDAFIPERWLPTAAGEAEKSELPYAGDRREAMQAFGYGPRDCLGRNMALHEMRLVLARLYFRFDFELCAAESTRWADDQRAFILWEKKPLFCSVRLAHE